MLKTGIIKKVDDLGRIVIPQEYRRKLKIKPNDFLEFYVSNNSNTSEIILKKYPSSEDTFEERCADYVREKKGVITGVFYSNDQTTVMTSWGDTVTVKRCFGDNFNINVAICYALAKAGYQDNNPIY